MGGERLRFSVPERTLPCVSFSALTAKRVDWRFSPDPILKANFVRSGFAEPAVPKRQWLAVAMRSGATQNAEQMVEPSRLKVPIFRVRALWRPGILWRSSVPKTATGVTSD